LLLLFVSWAAVLIFSFGLLNWSLGSKLTSSTGPISAFGDYIYLSGVTFITLGYGDVFATDTSGRIVAVLEAGLGFGFIAVVIGYMPVLYQAFSRREITISMLDARAGSPPTASEILLRSTKSNAMHRLDSFLAEWERWGAELLESTISFPVLVY